MVLYGLPGWIVLIWLFVLGTVIGSFLNVCVHRIPLHERLADQLRGLWSPPSRCPRCFHRILLRDNVPILGWLILRGRCRNCRAPISFRYPLIELLNGLLFVVVYWYEIPFGFNQTILDSPLHTTFGLSASTFWSNEAVLHWRYAFHMLLFESLLVASLIDLDTMSIPDGSTVPAMIGGILIGTLVPQVHLVPVWFFSPPEAQSYAFALPDWLQQLAVPESLRETTGLYVPPWVYEHPHLHGMAASLVGLIVGGGVVWGVRIIGHWVLRREAMGFGDVILMGLIGSFLGWQVTVAVFFLAPLFALAVVVLSAVFRRTREIPYGPYLSLGALAAVLSWRTLWPWLQHIYELGILVPIMGVVMGVMLAACLFVMQGVKRVLGIPLDGPDQFDEGLWRSADTLTYLAGENHDRFQGRWRVSEWPGVSAGRGTIHQETWRGSSRNGQHGGWK